MFYRLRYVLIPLMVLAVFETQALGDAQEDTIETARLLAIFLDSGRVTIGKNQQLINDAAQPTRDSLLLSFRNSSSMNFEKGPPSI